MSERIEHQRQGDRNREGYDQPVQAQDQRIDDGHLEIRGFKEPLEIIKPHPFASQDSGFRVVSAERQLHAVHRDVAEDEGQNNARQTEQPERSVSLELLDEAAFLFHCFCFHTLLLSIAELLNAENLFHPPSSLNIFNIINIFDHVK